MHSFIQRLTIFIYSCNNSLVHVPETRYCHVILDCTRNMCSLCVAYGINVTITKVILSAGRLCYISRYHSGVCIIVFSSWITERDRKYKTVTTSLGNQGECIWIKVKRKKKQIHLLMQNDGWSQDKITFNGKWIKQRIYSACYFQAWQPQLQFSIVIPTHYPWKLKGIQKHDTWWRRRIKLFPQKSERYLECQQLCRALLCGKLDENSAALDYQSATLGKGCRFWMSLISTEWEINASLKYLSAMRAERQLCYASLKAF